MRVIAHRLNGMSGERHSILPFKVGLGEMTLYDACAALDIEDYAAVAWDDSGLTVLPGEVVRLYSAARGIYGISVFPPRMYVRRDGTAIRRWSARYVGRRWEEFTYGDDRPLTPAELNAEIAAGRVDPRLAASYTPSNEKRR